MQEGLLNSLEDFSAKALAADPSDAAQAADLARNLRSMLPSLEPHSPAADLLTMGLATLESIQSAPPPDMAGLLDALAAAAAAVVKNADGGDDSAIADACAALKALAAAPQLAPAGPKPAAQDPRLDTDGELLKDFIAESCERIAGAEAAIMALESNPQDKEQINTVLRAFHTVKGASGFLGLDRIQELAHLAENLLIAAREGRVAMTGASADLALASCDVLRAMVKSRDPAGAAPEPDEARFAELTQRLGNVAAARCAGTNAPQAPQEVRPDAQGANHDAQAQPQGVRVNAQRLDDLVDMVGELLIAHSIVAQNPLVTGMADQRLTRGVSHAGKILRSLQDLSLRMRMVPLRSTFGKLARLVRDLSRRSGKAIRFVTSGEDTEIDRNMVEALGDPLVHMIRNSVDHGIEPAQQRSDAGKPAEGTIRLSAFHSAGNVVIELQDDGKGLDAGAILKQAISRGLVAADHDMTDAEIHSLIFLPGLSTATRVTEISGRGVGMDVVKRSIDSLRGKIEVRSSSHGATFTLRLPLTLAIADAMLVKVGAEQFLLPTISIEHSFRPAGGAIHTVTGSGEMVMSRGQLLPLFRLHKLFGINGAVADPHRALLMVVEGGGRRCALMVDELCGQQQVVIKSLGRLFQGIPGVAGGAVLGDGRVGLILDTAGLVQLAHGHASAAA
jgi:two-component system chemotaxis sensor kinase CheA